MSAPSSRAEPTAHLHGLRTYTLAIYLLHALSLLIGLLSSTFLVTAFVFGLPSLIAVAMNYARRSEAQGTWLAAHFTWQIRSFWFAAAWLLASTLLFGPLVLLGVGIPLLLMAYVATGLWAASRIGRGLLALRNGSGPRMLDPVATAPHADVGDETLP